MLILQLLIFAIPVIFAAVLHMIAVKMNWLPGLKIPIDLGKSYRGHRIFGDSKTFRGVILMMVFAIPGVYLLQYLCQTFPAVNELNKLNFNQYSPVLLGILSGLGYTLAELPNSFFKRRAGIEEGKRGTKLNIIIDQVDSVAGCLLILYPFSDINLGFILFGTVFYLLLHMAINYLLFCVGLRKNPL
jgi:hypothetical protein